MRRVYRICKASACAGKTQKEKKKKKAKNKLRKPNNLKSDRKKAESYKKYGIEWLLNLIKKLQSLQYLHCRIFSATYWLKNCR